MDFFFFRWFSCSFLNNHSLIRKTKIQRIADTEIPFCATITQYTRRKVELPYSLTRCPAPYPFGPRCSSCGKQIRSASLRAGWIVKSLQLPGWNRVPLRDRDSPFVAAVRASLHPNLPLFSLLPAFQPLCFFSYELDLLLSSSWIDRYNRWQYRHVSPTWEKRSHVVFTICRSTFGVEKRGNINNSDFHWEIKIIKFCEIKDSRNRSISIQFNFGIKFVVRVCQCFSKTNFLLYQHLIRQIVCYNCWLTSRRERKLHERISMFDS